MSTSKPTILHVIDTTGPGGAETVFLDIAEHLILDGYQSIALIKGCGWVQQQLESRDIAYVVLKPFGFLSIPYYYSVISLCRQHNIRFIQAHLLGSALTVAIVSMLTRIPAVATLHGQVDISDRERFFGIKRFLLRKGLKRIVAVSQLLADFLQTRKLFSVDQVSVIHNGVDTEKYSKAPSTDIRAELGLSGDATLIGSLGNIRPAKDYHTLIRAAKEVVSRYPDRHFVIAGHSKEPLQTTLNELIVELGLNKNIHFLGFRTDTVDFLKQLDCFALSSKAEGFSIATLEAMAAHVPVVVTRSGGPQEIVRPDVDGVMVDPCSPVKLADGINRVLSGDVHYVEEAFQRVRTDFSIQTSISKYQAIAYNYLPVMDAKDVASP